MSLSMASGMSGGSSSSSPKALGPLTTETAKNALRQKTRATFYRSWKAKRCPLAELCSRVPSAGKSLRGKSRRLRFYTGWTHGGLPGWDA
jgi:hypothetical protein